MRKSLLVVFCVLLIFPVTSGATTHIWFWVNGNKANTTIQGDIIAWELDLAQSGNTVSVEIYLDKDASRTINDADLLLETLVTTDGEQGDGPSDSSAVPDGIIYLNFGPFGLAPENYVLQVIDQDQSTAENWFEVLEMSDPPATVTGIITIEGTEKPDPGYANIMIGAMGENGIFSGFTDASGNYAINLPVADAGWEISSLFESTLPDYIQEPRRYELTIPAGNTGSINFTFSMPSAYVYGSLYDQNGLLIERDGFIQLQNVTTGSEKESVVKSGQYTIPAQVVIQGADSTNMFRLRFDNEIFNPDYLAPGDTPEFALSWGDSVAHNLVAYEANAKIYGYVTRGGQNPSASYEFGAWSDSLGQTITASDAATGYFELFVRTGSGYNVWLQDDPQWGTPPPPGYILEQNWKWAMPGDTVYFNFIPATAALAGSITFDPGDPADLDYDRTRVSAWDSSYSTSYDSPVDHGNNFLIPVTGGKYDVEFHQDDMEYLAMPHHYEGISVSADTVDTLNFELNYAHAQIRVRLRGDVPVDQAGWYWINTMGQWPWVYQTGAEMGPDSSYFLKVCEGQWYLQPPIWVSSNDYALLPSDTVLTVTENDSVYEVEFTYRLWTGLAEEVSAPVHFYLNQNYPNPFNPSTTIGYGLTRNGQVRLEVFNLLGQKVATLVNAQQNAGTYRVTWNPADLASGVYLYRLQTEGFVQTKKLILVR